METIYLVDDWANPLVLFTDLCQGYSTYGNPQPTGRKARKEDQTYTEFTFTESSGILWWKKPRAITTWILDSHWKIKPEFVITQG